MLPGKMTLANQMNQWIALTGELEDTHEKIAKLLYSQYKAGRVHDEFCLDLCRKLDALYEEAQRFESDLVEDFKVYTEAKVAAPGGEGKAKAEKAKVLAQSAANKASGLLSRLYIKHNVASYKRHFRDAYLDLGQRVVLALEEGHGITDDPQIRKFARYGGKLKKETNMRWEEIEILNRENVRGNGFLAALQTFVTNLSIWGRSNGLPFAKKYLKVDDNMTKKIREEYRKNFLQKADGK
jgi:hypothetical protein